jgi:hypothetical protein
MSDESIRAAMKRVVGISKPALDRIARTGDDGEWHEANCANHQPVMVEIQGVYDGGLFHMCRCCDAMWHRWPPGDRLHTKAAEVMASWRTVREAKRADPEPTGP